MQIDINSVPLAIYVHIPWCVEKCPYCDFNSHKLKTTLAPEREYIVALEQNMKQYKNMVNKREVSSIFFGGGTPSLIASSSIAKIIELIKIHFNVASDAEITLEANPGTFEQKKFKGFLEGGVNRLSIGVQSFNDAMLKALGRIHDSNSARNAIHVAQDVGFNNINIDLMYGLPNQTLKISQLDLETALEFKTNHLSWYQLTLEPNTLFYVKPPVLPKSEAVDAIEQSGYEILNSNNMHQYEISGWCRNKTNICRHNYNIWKFGDYIGIGAGACGKITLSNCIIRTMQTKNPRQYLANTNKINDKIVAQADLPFEVMLNILRLAEPIYFKLIKKRAGISRDDIITKLKSIPDHFVKIDSEKFQLTRTGFRFYNDIVAAFMQD